MALITEKLEKLMRKHSEACGVYRIAQNNERYGDDADEAREKVDKLRDELRAEIEAMAPNDRAALVCMYDVLRPLAYGGKL